MKQKEKSFNEVIQPYIKTILVAILGTFVFTLVFDFFLKDKDNINAELIAQYEKKRDSLLNVIELQGKQLNQKGIIIQELDKLLMEKEKEKVVVDLDSLREIGANVKEIKGNDIKYKAEIESALSSADKYLGLEIFRPESHRSIINKLNKLYSIIELSPSQNSGLIFRIRQMNSMQIRDFMKKAKTMKQDELVNESKRLLKLKGLTPTQKSSLKSIGVTLKRKTYVVKSGETLFQISRKFNVKMETLRKLNRDKIDSKGNIKEGDKLVISN